MKVLLVDDEPLAIEVLEILLKKIDNVKIVGKYTNPEKAFSALSCIDVDVIFLDMEMGSIHGLQFAEKVVSKYPKIEVIFVTAHPQFALDAFEVNAIDYILKPVNPLRLKKSIEKVRQRVELYRKKRTTTEMKKPCLYIQTLGTFKLFDLEGNEVKWRTKKAKELFAYLFNYRGQAVSRAHIMDELWGDLPEDRASNLMHTTLYQVRKAIRDVGFENPITLVNEQYALDVPINSDLEQLERILSLTDISSDPIKKAINLYAGDYFEDEDYRWTHSIQAEVRQSFLTFLEKYIENEEDCVQICLEKMSELEPYNEHYTYLLLDYYGTTKSTKKLVTFYEMFKERWIEDLGIDVPEEIISVYEKHIC